MTEDFPPVYMTYCMLVCLSFMALASCVREKVNGKGNDIEKTNADYVIKLHVHEQSAQASVADGLNKPLLKVRNFLKSESIGASQCVVIKQKRDKD
jgi:hypothetical protein